MRRRADNSAFAYENLLDRDVGLMERPRITAETVGDITQFFGVECFEVRVKYSQFEILELLGVQLSVVHAYALKSRYRMFEFSRQISSATVDGDIPPPDHKLCTCDMAVLFNKYLY